MNGMKAMIVGGGVAGLAVAISLRRSGYKVNVYEKSPTFAKMGHGFLLREHGLKALDQLGVGIHVRKQAIQIKRVVVQRADGAVIVNRAIENCFSIARHDCVDILRRTLANHSIFMGMSVCQLQVRDQQPHVTAHFTNGRMISGDFLIAADGENSAIRSHLFPQFRKPEARIKELVCTLHAPDIAKQLGCTFVKIIHEKGGLELGMAPLERGRVLWYLQFDSQRWGSPAPAAVAKQNFVRTLLANWPEPVAAMIANSDFSQAQIFDVLDAHLLPNFYHRNVVLIGDAAHMPLSMTSQGANLVLMEAVSLGQNLQGRYLQASEFHHALARFAEQRRQTLQNSLEPAKKRLQDLESTLVNADEAAS